MARGSGYESPLAATAHFAGTPPTLTGWRPWPLWKLVLVGIYRLPRAIAESGASGRWDDTATYGLMAIAAVLFVIIAVHQAAIWLGHPWSW